MKIPKKRHNLRYKQRTWNDLEWLAKQMDMTVTELMEEALNRGLSWVAKKNGYKLPSQIEIKARKEKAHREEARQAEEDNKKIPQKAAEPQEPERTDEEIDQNLNELFRDLESKRQGRELTMEEYLQGVKDGKWK